MKITKVSKCLTNFSLSLFVCFALSSYLLANEQKNSNNEIHPSVTSAQKVLDRVLGEQLSQRFNLSINNSNHNEIKELDRFQISVSENKIFIKANSPIALTRGAYDYLKRYQNGLLTWSGSNLSLPKHLDNVSYHHQTPYQYRYYFNVVTHGYSTAYWDWERWQKEIDWMAMHGINMPLIGGAHEAILFRAFLKLGLNKEEAMAYFSGPAHFPWNRMGNLIGWDGSSSIPDSYFNKQIALTHKQLKRLRSLGMSPIVHAFAGFVPPAITRLYPKENIRRLSWGGGLPQESYGYLLSPNSSLFEKIGKLYIELWEQEFGKNEFYLADSFNEMDVPKAHSEDALLKELQGYGDKVYRSIKAANSDATWVMQGWTFPYHKDENKERFWTANRLHALVSKVPDDKLLILDLANEYNKLWWKIDPSWKLYDGFFNKKWIYSFIPNMGGKTPLNGVLDIYATIPIDALDYKQKGNLVGYGIAPEGIENNEMLYELTLDMAWQTAPIELKNWQRNYAIARYGKAPESILKAYEYLNTSAYGTFVDHPIHRFQLRPYKNPEGVEDHATVHESKVFKNATICFLEASEQLKNNRLYLYDAVEITSLFLSLVIDDLLHKFEALPEEESDYALIDEATSLMQAMDKLLAEHPSFQLESWVQFARNWGSNESEKAYYESNAKRLLTTWGGDPVNDYSARVWSGLVKDYYLPRWKKYHDAKKSEQDFDIRSFEEEWILTPYIYRKDTFDDPISEAKKLVAQYKNYLGK